jgi:hypothetical protein
VWALSEMGGGGSWRHGNTDYDLIPRANATSSCEKICRCSDY